MTKRRGSVHIALLRGINVGGKNKLPMKELVAIVEQTGCTEIRSYIQSGNLVFRAGAPLARRLPDLVSSAIAEQFGYAVPVLLRTAGELRPLAVAPYEAPVTMRSRPL